MDLGPRYQFIQELGKGGMGRVLLVRDGHLQKDLALKILHPNIASSVAIESFRKEFALLSSLEHPGVACAHDFGFLSGRPYFTRQFIPGSPLCWGGERPALEQLLRWAIAIAEAVAFLHRSGILHLDIKPTNIIVPFEGQEG